MQAITPRVRLTQLKARVDKILDAPTKRALKEFEKTASNFRRVTPEFISKKLEEGNNVIVAVGVFKGEYKHPATDNWIYAFLLEGTKVRYAKMTPDWRSGTSPNKLGTSQATGSVAVVDVTNPLPGIPARNWHKIIAALEQKEINNEAAHLFKNADLFKKK